MPRSVWKGPFVSPGLLKKVKKASESGRNYVIKTDARSSFILPQFVGLTFAVYNGKTHVPVTIIEDMIGMKLGEFAPTRNHPGYSGTDKKGKK